MSEEVLAKVFAIIGYPLKHTLSPLMHNALYIQEKIAAIYVPLEVAPKDLENAVRGIRALNISGVNVTIPHKEKVIQYLDSCDKRAKIIGAVNTIKREADGRLVGYNTDGQGFIVSLKKAGFNPQNKRAVLLGAGGAAKAVATYLADSGIRRLHIYDVNVMQTLSLVERIGSNFTIEVRAATKLEELPLAETDILINATPIGMRENDPLLIKKELISKNIFVYDLVYNPPETKLIKAAKEQQAATQNGLWMLIYQGAVAAQLWLGVDSHKASLIMHAALQKHKFCA